MQLAPTVHSQNSVQTLSFPTLHFFPSSLVSLPFRPSLPFLLGPSYPIPSLFLCCPPLLCYCIFSFPSFFPAFSPHCYLLIPSLSLWIGMTLRCSQPLRVKDCRWGWKRSVNIPEPLNGSTLDWLGRRMGRDA